MADLASPKSMLARAQRQIADLDIKIKEFMNDKPWSHVVEKDINGVTDVHKLKFTTRLSDDLPHIVFETANNLRAALDQLGFSIASLAGHTNPKSCKFPMGPDEDAMRNNAKGACEDLPPEIRSLFKGFKPYKRGNNTLWALNELANGPKHKLLYPIAIGGNRNFFHLSAQGGSVMTIPPDGIATKMRLYFFALDLEQMSNTISSSPFR
jgi:hypothetical protein